MIIIALLITVVADNGLHAIAILIRLTASGLKL